MNLTAPPDVQRRLLDLHELDTRLLQLRKRTDDHPLRTQISEAEAGLRELNAATGELLGRVDDANAELRRREAEVEVVNARMKRDEALLTQVASAKDTQGIESELAALVKRKSDLEDLELGAMEDAEAAQAALDAHERTRRDARNRLDTLKTELEQQLSALEQQRVSTIEQRAALVSELPDDLVALYERQRERYGAGASLLRRRVSSASGFELTGNDLQIVRSASPDAVLLCPDSQAILIRTEESGL